MFIHASTSEMHLEILEWMKVIVIWTSDNSNENTMEENVIIFSSSIFSRRTPSVQITTSLFTLKYKLTEKERKCSDCYRYLFYWDLLSILHGYRTNQWLNTLKMHLGLQQIMTRPLHEGQCQLPNHHYLLSGVRCNEQCTRSLLAWLQIWT